MVLLGNFPTLGLSYKEMSSNLKGKYSKSLEESRRTTLFVLHCKDKESWNQTFEALEMIKNLSEKSSLPRCLIVSSFSSTEHLNGTLHSLWQSKYLDITILTYQQRQMMLETKPPKKPYLNQINPFTTEFSSRIISSESQWFPNKLRDLNRYKLNFTYELNLLDRHRERDLETKFTEIMKRTMNFESNLNSTQTDVLKYDPHEYFHYFFPNPPNVRIQKIGHIKAVIPNKVKFTKDIVVLPEFWYMVLITIGTIATVKLAVFLMEFKRSVWQSLNIIQIIIGMSANQEPRNVSGRIVFGSILITCLVYSSYFYSVILDVTWRKEPEILSLEELIESPLTPVMPVELYFTLEYSDFPNIKQLVGRSRRHFRLMMKLSYSPSVCLDYLADYQNISCLIPDAEYHVNKYKSENKELVVKILPESVEDYISKWRAKPKSPYIDRFNEIILRTSESGLLNDNAKPRSKFQNTLPPEKIEKNTLLLVLFYVAVIGYSLSTIVFLLEVFLANFGKRLCGCCTRFCKLGILY